MRRSYLPSDRPSLGESRNYGQPICKLCAELDGISSSTIVAYDCTNRHTGKHFSAYVCKNCLDAGRETRVTCRSFVRTK